jgi:hypothetical protein
MGAQRGILLTKGDIEKLYALIDDALYVIDKYHSADDTEFSEDPDYALDKILEKLEEASAILERWLKKLEDE